MKKQFNLQNRRYIGNKYKLLDWIFENVQKNCDGETFLDIFAGTGVVAERFLKTQKKIILNDFLYSNKVIYEAFFNSNGADYSHLEKVADIKFADSKENVLIQLADLVASSIFRSTQTGKADYKDYVAILNKHIAEIRQV